MIKPPRIHILFAPRASRAVVVAEHSGRLSRMFVWDTAKDRVSRSTWVKARIFPMDVSADGEHVAYFARAYDRRTSSYLAVSRPPHFRALFFWPCFRYGPAGACFGKSHELLVVGGHAEESPRIEPSCPFKLTVFNRTYEDDVADIQTRFNEIKFDSERRIGANQIVHLYGDHALMLGRGCWPKTHLDAIQAILVPNVRDGQVAMQWDHKGRLIVRPGDGRVYAILEDGTTSLLMNLNYRTLEEVVPPEWARSWTGKRSKEDQPNLSIPTFTQE